MGRDTTCLGLAKGINASLFGSFLAGCEAIHKGFRNWTLGRSKSVGPQSMHADPVIWGWVMTPGARPVHHL